MKQSMDTYCGLYHFQAQTASGVSGLSFVIQSEYSTAYLDDRIEAFIAWAEVMSLFPIGGLDVFLTNTVSINSFYY